MKNILLRVIDFCKTYKKRILTVIGSGILAIIVIAGIAGGVMYSQAKSNIKYSQDQLQKIALGKVPGEVVDVEKEFNLRNKSFQYEFKIKDKENMLQEVKVDARYGGIFGLDNESHNKDKNKHDKNERRHSKG